MTEKRTVNLDKLVLVYQSDGYDVTPLLELIEDIRKENAQTVRAVERIG